MDRPLKYYVDGTNVMSRNYRWAAQCGSEAMARRIAKLLNADEERKKQQK